ncbi:FeoA family protein [Oscillatoria acuminata]|uniref:Fe2+ transport system protein A n=1 Tax=Oscillatoria acuminata PCC 6304 TaxID=56110 RepID=K9TJC8_9CYAN|nr:FeoA family protein [Oscillatoria acuminata]AFY82947.1 Fe2+ transport system protein A [Oscillatoria acuminata PCC 6304]
MKGRKMMHKGEGEGYRNPKDTWFSYFGAATRPQRTEEISPPCNPQDGTGYSPLSQAQAGDRLRVTQINGGNSLKTSLAEMGVREGTELVVIDRSASGSAIVMIGDQQIGVGAGMAEKILCIQAIPGSAEGQKPRPLSNTRLREIAIGAKGRILGYESTNRSYKRRLLSMGLTPGTEFKIIRHAPLGDPTEIKVRGFSLTLRKDEADALCIEKVDR